MLKGTGRKKTKAGRGSGRGAVARIIPKIPSKYPLANTYVQALPFELHERDDASPLLNRVHNRYIDSESSCSVLGRIMRLPGYESGIADQALQAGLRVSIKCSPDFAPDIAGAFAQRIPSRTLVYYDDKARRLVFRHENEEAIHNKQESEEE